MFRNCNCIYISNQQDAAKFVLLILLSLLYVFRAIVSLIFRSTLTVYTAFWNRPVTLSLVGRISRVGTFFQKACHLSAADSKVDTLFQKAVYTVKVLLEMGETIARNV